jgi:hypothetical protein
MLTIIRTPYAYHLRRGFLFFIVPTFAPENEKHLARVQVPKPIKSKKVKK